MTTEFLERPGGRISYDDSGGDGPLVIAAPGMGDSRKVYRHIAPALTDAGLRIATMDLRGIGESTVNRGACRRMWAHVGAHIAGYALREIGPRLVLSGTGFRLWVGEVVIGQV